MEAQAYADHLAALAEAEERKVDGLAAIEGDWWDALIEAATDASKKDAQADAVRLKAIAQANTDLAQDDAEAWAWFEGELVDADERQSQADAESLKLKQLSIDLAYGERLKTEAREAAALDKVEAGAWSTYVGAVGQADVTYDTAVNKADNTWRGEAARAHADAVERWASDQDLSPAGRAAATRQTADAAARATFEETNGAAANTYLDASATASKQWYDDVAPKAKTYLETLADDALTYMNAVAPQLVTFLDALVSNAVTAFNAVVDELTQFADATLGNAVSWLTSVTTNLNEAAGEVVDNAKTAFNKVATEANEYFNKVGDAQAEATDESTTTNTGLARDLAASLISFATGAFGDLLGEAPPENQAPPENEAPPENNAPPAAPPENEPPAEEDPSDEPSASGSPNTTSSIAGLAMFNVPPEEVPVDGGGDEQDDDPDGDAPAGEEEEDRGYVPVVVPNFPDLSPTWAAVKAGFHTLFVEEIYGGAKALVTGEAGKRLGKRAVKIVENNNQSPFTGSAGESFQFATRGILGELSSMNGVGEAIGNADLETEQPIDGYGKVQRYSMGVGTVGTIFSAGPSVVTRVAGAEAAAKSFPWMTAAGKTAMPGSAAVSRYLTNPANQYLLNPMGRAAGSAVDLLPTSVQNFGRTTARVMTKERHLFWQQEAASNAPVSVQFPSRQSSNPFSELVDSPAALVDPQLDVNLLSHLANPNHPNHAAAVKYAQANQAAGLSANRHSYRKFLENYSKEQFSALRETYGIRLIREISLEELDTVATRLEQAFVGTDRVISAEDARVAASAFLRGEKLATNDLHFYKRARDLGLNVDFVGSGNAAANAARYSPRPVSH